MMEKHNGTGLTRVYRAAKCSIAGIGYAFKNEEAFRLELLICLFLVPVAFFITDDPATLILLIGTLVLVLVVECINSAIEATIDRISTERHPLSKQAKDLGSAAVFLCMLLAGFCWGIVLFY